MFKRFFQWLANQRRQQVRAIFQYWDGAKERAADPFLLWKALQDDPEYLSSKHDALIDGGEKIPLKDTLEAQEIAVRAVQRAFDVKPFEQGGLMHAEALGLLMAFYLYLEALKKNISPTPISPAPSDSPSSDPSTTSAA